MPPEDLKQHTKIIEYTQRILGGENRMQIEAGLPDSFKEAIAALLDSEPENDPILRVYNEVWRANKLTLQDEMFLVGKGAFPDNKGAYAKVDGEIGRFYDAHGIDKGDQLRCLLQLLKKGIRTDKAFYTAPFEAPDEHKALLGAALGTASGTAYKSGLAVLTSGYKENLQTHGIKHVFINDVFGRLVPLLAQRFPKYRFHLLSEQKAVLEGAARS